MQFGTISELVPSMKEHGYILLIMAMALMGIGASRIGARLGRVRAPR